MFRGVVLVPGPLPRPLSALALVGFVGFDDAGKAVVSLRFQGADDRHPPAPDAVTRRTQHLGPAAAGHRLRCLDHVTRQRDHQVGAMDPGQMRPAEPRPRCSAPRAIPSLCARSSPTPPGARVASTARAGRRRAASIGPRVDLKDSLGTLARISNESFGLAQFLRGQAGKQAAEFGRIKARHGGSPEASEASAYLTEASEQSADQHDLLTPPTAACSSRSGTSSEQKPKPTSKQLRKLKQWPRN